MKRLLLAAAAVLALGVLAMAIPDTGGPKRGLTVHEWGTFTSVSLPDGNPQLWFPLAGPNDLPRFVYKGAFRKFQGALGMVRMETPVLYFYSDREQEMSVSVDFPKGNITEFYPKAKLRGRGVDWGKIRIVPGGRFTFPREEAPSHYYPARETDADPIVANGQAEKFLFYRGIGSFGLPLRVELEGRRVRIRPTSDQVLGTVILYEKRGGKAGWRTATVSKDAVVVDRPECDRDVGDLHRELEGLLVTRGLYRREAKAMIETWRDTWFEEGVRVFYFVPRAETDRILPLKLDPRPESLVRVLVGRAEVLTPELEAEVRVRVDAAREAADAEWRETSGWIRSNRFVQVALQRMTTVSKDRAFHLHVHELLTGKRREAETE